MTAYPFKSNIMKAKIIEIIGFGMEPERAELIAERILELFVEMQNPCSQCSYKEELRDAHDHINELYSQIMDMNEHIQRLGRECNC